MRPDRDDAMSVSGRYAKFHAPAHIFARPVGAPVGADRRDGAARRPVGIGGARPDMALVEMGVDVDKARPDDRGA
jgi:hypothetical protein